MGYRVRHMGAEFYEHDCDYCVEGDRLPMPKPTVQTIRVDHDRLRTCTLTVAQLVEAAHVLGLDLVVTAEPTTGRDTPNRPGDAAQDDDSSISW
jgi:hypothetical protein